MPKQRVKLQSNKIPALLQRLEGQLRQGQSDQIEVLARQINFKSVPHEHRLKFANIFRRSHITRAALRMLAPIFESSIQQEGVQYEFPKEMAEYSINLMRLGSVREAESHLRKIKKEQAPEALLYLSFCLFSQWKYREAIPSLENYTAVSSLSDYQRCVGKVNLAAALVATESPEAKLLLEDLIVDATQNEWTRLLSNTFELSAQHAISLGEVQLAEKFILESGRAIGDTGVNDSLYAKKWHAVIKSIGAQDIQPLCLIKKELLAAKQWESVRNIDYHCMEISPEKQLLDRLYFGTPYQAYREKLSKEFGDPSTKLNFGGGSGPAFDLAMGELEGKNIIKPGKLTHNLMKILFRDLYRPIRLGGIFSELFPGEYFDIYSSPDRVYQAMKRLRQWIRREKFPIEIVEVAGDYQIVDTGQLNIELTTTISPICTEKVYLRRVREKLGSGNKLRTQEIAQCLNVSRPTANRFLQWAVANNYIVKSGAGPQTYYIVLDFAMTA